MRRAPRNSLFVLLLLLPGAAWGQPAARDVKAAERAQAAEVAAQKDAADRAARAVAEEQRLGDERIAAAERLRATEIATAQAAARMDALSAQRRDAATRLAKRAEAMQPLLPLIQRLALYPAETLLAVPASPEDRLRGVLVLQGLARQLETEAEALRQDQAALEATIAAEAAEAPKLAAARAAQAERAAALDSLLTSTQAQRRRAETESEAAARRAAAEAARADTLRAALAALETQRKAEEAAAHEEALRAEKQKHAAEAEAARQREAALARPSGSLSGAQQARGQLTAPVSGTITRAFGAPTEAGAATGLAYQPAPGARVVAPCGGRIAFADKFRSYGQLVIIDCGGGYHAVLSGLDRLDARIGQTPRAGEPVGVMADWEPGSTARRPVLYLELRKDGLPVNPGPWLRASG